MDPNTPGLIYCQNAQTFINHITLFCTIVIALATLVSLVFTVVTAIIGSSIYKLNRDLRSEHDKLKQSIRDQMSDFNALMIDCKIQLETAKKMAYKLAADPKLLKNREFLDSFIETLKEGKYIVGTQPGEIISAMFNLSELGDLNDMKRLVKIRALAEAQKLHNISTNATSALLRITEKQ